MNNQQQLPRTGPVRASLGFTLVELMISMVIGMVVIGAVYSAYTTSGSGQNSNAALSQMSEDATLALNLIRKQVALAGYSQPYQLSNKGFDRRYGGQALAGCDAANFDNPTAATIAGLNCNGADANNSAIAVAYEADNQNTLMTAANLPRDCVGSGIAQTPQNGLIPAHWVAESRLYINGNSLMCQGNGQAILPVAGGAALTTAPQPLVNNIVNMRIRYGVSNNVQVSGVDGTLITQPGRTPARFLTAAAIRTAGATTWNNVTAVRVCIVVRSEREVLDQNTPYYGCEAQEAAAPTLTPAPDRRMYRAFSTTVMVKNRLGG